MRDRLIGAGVVFVLVAILAVAGGWRILRDDPTPTSTQGQGEVAGPSDPGTTTPAPSSDQWPAEVQPLAEFVEENRGGPFEHPVPIDFLSREEYEAAAQAESQDLTPEDQADLDMFEGQLRALGLLDADTSVQDATEQMYGGGTLAFYDPEADEVKVLGTELDVAGKVTLVHELTHAWQDQHGYLDGLDDLDDGQAYTLQALAEGDAMRIEDLYVDTLSDRELDEYYEQSADQGDAVDLGGVPDALIAVFSSYYSLGGPFVAILDDQGGNAEVDAALSDPPPAEADIVDPNRYVAGAQPVEVAEPSVPDGAERLDGGTFGAVSWLVTLSEQVDPRTVLHVVDGWAGDQSVVYRQDGRTCTAAAFRGTTPEATAAASAQMSAWAAAMPDFSATVEQVGDDAVLRSCEPTVPYDVVGRSQLAVDYAALRLQVMSEALAGGTTWDEATCFGNAVVDAISPEDMANGAAYDPDTTEKIGAAAAQACFN